MADAGLALQAGSAVPTTLQTTFGLPAQEVLIEDFSCAVKRKILLHGRMSITTEHVCFNSDIFGLKTTVVIPMRDVVSIRRTMTDFINPSVEISTATERHLFASFVFRDHVYEILCELLRIQRHYQAIASPARPAEGHNATPRLPAAASPARAAEGGQMGGTNASPPGPAAASSPTAAAATSPRLVPAISPTVAEPPSTGPAPADRSSSPPHHTPIGALAFPSAPASPATAAPSPTHGAVLTPTNSAAASLYTAGAPSPTHATTPSPSPAAHAATPTPTPAATSSPAHTDAPSPAHTDAPSPAPAVAPAPTPAATPSRIWPVSLWPRPPAPPANDVASPPQDGPTPKTLSLNTQPPNTPSPSTPAPNTPPPNGPLLNTPANDLVTAPSNTSPPNIPTPNTPTTDNLPPDTLPPDPFPLDIPAPNTPSQSVPPPSSPPSNIPASNSHPLDTPSSNAPPPHTPAASTDRVQLSALARQGSGANRAEEEGVGEAGGSGVGGVEGLGVSEAERVDMGGATSAGSSTSVGEGERSCVGGAEDSGVRGPDGSSVGGTAGLGLSGMEESCVNVVEGSGSRGIEKLGAREAEASSLEEAEGVNGAEGLGVSGVEASSLEEADASGVNVVEGLGGSRVEGSGGVEGGGVSIGEADALGVREATRLGPSGVEGSTSANEGERSCSEGAEGSGASAAAALGAGGPGAGQGKDSRAAEADGSGVRAGEPPLQVTASAELGLSGAAGVGVSVADGSGAEQAENSRVGEDEVTLQSAASAEPAVRAGSPTRTPTSPSAAGGDRPVSRNAPIDAEHEAISGSGDGVAYEANSGNGAHKANSGRGTPISPSAAATNGPGGPSSPMDAAREAIPGSGDGLVAREAYSGNGDRDVGDLNAGGGDGGAFNKAKSGRGDGEHFPPKDASTLGDHSPPRESKAFAFLRRLRPQLAASPPPTTKGGASESNSVNGDRNADKANSSGGEGEQFPPRESKALGFLRRLRPQLSAAPPSTTQEGATSLQSSPAPARATVQNGTSDSTLVVHAATEAHLGGGGASNTPDFVAAAEATKGAEAQSSGGGGVADAGGEGSCTEKGGKAGGAQAADSARAKSHLGEGKEDGGAQAQTAASDPGEAIGGEFSASASATGAVEEEGGSLQGGGEGGGEGEGALSAEPLEHEVLSTTLPCSAAHARHALFGDRSTFFSDFLAAQGGSDIEIEPWSELRDGGGLLREIRRVQKVRSRFSPVRSTRVHETQRLGVAADGAVVLATHQLSLDVPYADYFAIHTKMCLRDEPAEPSSLVGPVAASTLLVTVEVTFCKWTIVQSRITTGALSDLRHAYNNAGLPTLREYLTRPAGGEAAAERALAGGGSVQGATAGAATAESVHSRGVGLGASGGVGAGDSKMGGGGKGGGLTGGGGAASGRAPAHARARIRNDRGAGEEGGAVSARGRTTSVRDLPRGEGGSRGRTDWQGGKDSKHIDGGSPVRRFSWASGLVRSGCIFCLAALDEAAQWVSGPGALFVLEQLPSGATRRARARLRVKMLEVHQAGGRAALAMATLREAGRVLLLAALLFAAYTLARASVRPPGRWVGGTAEGPTQELRARLACIERSYAALHARAAAWEACALEATRVWEKGEARDVPAACVSLPPPNEALPAAIGDVCR